MLGGNNSLFYDFNTQHWSKKNIQRIVLGTSERNVADIVLNILLFAPFGFGLRQYHRTEKCADWLGFLNAD